MVGKPDDPRKIPLWTTGFRHASEIARREGRAIFVDFFDPG